MFMMLFQPVPKTMLLQQRNLLVLIVLISISLKSVSRVEAGVWCIAKEDVPDAELQRTLDYACIMGADCTKIQEGQPCYFPNTVRDHASYAINSYFQATGRCYFAYTATLTVVDPSHGECKFDYFTFFE